jgi:transcriptional regulator with XRE-family HTH domain
MSVVATKGKKRSLGETIVALRRESGLNQKDLAARIRREDGSVGISAQYLNDIEHDRRTPMGDHLIRELAKALRADSSFLAFLAGQLPAEIRDVDVDPVRLKVALAAFRRAAKSGSEV